MYIVRAPTTVKYLQRQYCINIRKLDETMVEIKQKELSKRQRMTLLIKYKKIVLCQSIETYAYLHVTNPCFKNKRASGILEKK
jgi:hypothetical protein